MTFTDIKAPTTHINAKKGDFADTVLMPGDPKRAEYIAKNFLQNAKLINNVRGIQGYTGTYKNTPVSVMASGMGIPSIGIYSFELYTAFDVKQIIRTGTAQSLQNDIKIKDIVIATGASTNSNFAAATFNMPGTPAPVPSLELLKKADTVVNEMKLTEKTKFGTFFTTDSFYKEVYNDAEWAKMGTIAVDMETAGLYLIAERLNKKSLSICTISDELNSNVTLSYSEKETSLSDMITLALEIAILN